MNSITQTTMSITKRSVAFIAAAFLTVMLTAGAAYAASFTYKTSASRLAANTAVGSGPVNIYGNRISGCELPNFNVHIYLKTSGNSTIRSKFGTCGTTKTEYFHATENATNSWCANNSGNAKFVQCKRWYN